MATDFISKRPFKNLKTKEAQSVALTHKVEDSSFLLLNSTAPAVIFRKNAEPSRVPTKRAVARNNCNRAINGHSIIDPIHILIKYRILVILHVSSYCHRD